jgi:arylformamidase
MLYDITRTIGQDTLVYPGDSTPRLEWTNTIRRGASSNVSRLELGSHTGTHLDAPYHFDEEGVTVSEIPAGRLCTVGTVLDVPDHSVVAPEALRGVKLDPGEALLFKTRNGQLPRGSLSLSFVSLSTEIAEQIVEMRLGLVGIDYLSVDSANRDDHPVHRILLGAGIPILEDVDLRRVPAGRYMLWCLPLKVRGAEAAPCRAVLQTLAGG